MKFDSLKAFAAQRDDHFLRIPRIVQRDISGCRHGHRWRFGDPGIYHRELGHGTHRQRDARSKPEPARELTHLSPRSLRTEVLTEQTLAEKKACKHDKPLKPLNAAMVD